jgi:hypothetical protein
LAHVHSRFFFLTKGPKVLMEIERNKFWHFYFAFSGTWFLAHVHSRFFFLTKGPNVLMEIERNKFWHFYFAFLFHDERHKTKTNCDLHETQDDIPCKDAHHMLGIQTQFVSLVRHWAVPVCGLHIASHSLISCAD